MRTYGKKILGRKIQSQVQYRRETKDAILWDVDLYNRFCRVKIQGSDSYVVAHYPDNMEETPPWMRPGNAVKIVHTQGVRGRIEIIGHGQVIPTPVTGDVFPPAGSLVDALISGLQLVPSSGGGMFVEVTSGSVRLGGIIYEISGQSMAMGSSMVMGNFPALMGAGAGTVLTIDPVITEGHWRYDLIIIGSDLAISVEKGSESQTPEMPDCPDAHLSLGYILVPYGATEITASMINSIWKPPEPSSLLVSPELEEGGLMKWWIVHPDPAAEPPEPGEEGPTSQDITVTVMDQYGNPIIREGSAVGWKITAAVLEGDIQTFLPYAYTGTDASAPFYMFRHMTEEDSTPVIEFTLANWGTAGAIKASIIIPLWDADDNLMR